MVKPLKKFFTCAVMFIAMGSGLAAICFGESAPEVRGVCIACHKDPCACPGQDAGSWEDRKAFLEERRQWLLEQQAVSAANAARAKREKRDIAREKEKERYFDELSRGIIRVTGNISLVAAPMKTVNLPSGTEIFGIGLSMPIEELKRPIGYTAGTRVASENLRRCLSIIQAMAAIPAGELGMEDARFFMEQAGFALEPDTPLELEVEPAALKSKISAKDIQEFEGLLDETARVEESISACQREQARLLPGLEAVEKEVEEALRDNNPAYEELKKKYDAQLNAYAQSSRSEQIAARRLQENQLSAKKFASRFIGVDLTVGYDLPETK